MGMCFRKRVLLTGTLLETCGLTENPPIAEVKQRWLLLQDEWFFSPHSKCPARCDCNQHSGKNDFFIE